MPDCLVQLTFFPILNNVINRHPQPQTYLFYASISAGAAAPFWILNSQTSNYKLPYYSQKMSKVSSRE